MTEYRTAAQHRLEAETLLNEGRRAAFDSVAVRKFAEAQVHALLAALPDPEDH